jgi:hypothetical protein
LTDIKVNTQLRSRTAPARAGKWMEPVEKFNDFDDLFRCPAGAIATQTRLQVSVGQYFRNMSMPSPCRRLGGGLVLNPSQTGVSGKPIRPTKAAAARRAAADEFVRAD